MKTSKNRIALLIFSVFFIGILMTSCTNDDETPDETTGSILGRWALDKRSYTANGVTSPEMDYENNNPGCALNDYFEVKDNGVFVTGYYSPSCTADISTGSWTRTGNLITTSYPSEDDVILELLSLTPTVMKVRVNMTGTDGVEPGLVLFVNFTMVKVN